MIMKPQTANQPSQWITQTAAIELVTRSLLPKLGEPDMLKPNPNHRSGPPMRLFDRARVEAFAAAHQAEIDEAKLKAEKRAVVGRDVADKRRERLIAQAQTINIEVVWLDDRALERASIKHYNELWASRGDYGKTASKTDSPEFLDRIAVNYLRHMCSHYENFLVALTDAPGAHEARGLIRTRVLKEIARAYPRLADECQKQDARRNGVSQQ